MLLGGETKRRPKMMLSHDGESIANPPWISSKAHGALGAGAVRRCV